MAFPNVAFASDQGNGQTEQYSEVISIQASETVGPDTKYPESLSKAPNYSDFSTKLEIIDYIQNGPKSFLLAVIQLQPMSFWQNHNMFLPPKRGM